MSIAFEILGSPGRDNALLVRVDSGQSITRLLFDCGDGCLNAVPYSEILSTDHLFLSHLHMDHVGGFDYFFRCLFNRESKPNHIWGRLGPPTSSIIDFKDSCGISIQRCPALGESMMFLKTTFQHHDLNSAKRLRPSTMKGFVKEM